MIIACKLIKEDIIDSKEPIYFSDKEIENMYLNTINKSERYVRTLNEINILNDKKIKIEKKLFSMTVILKNGLYHANNEKELTKIKSNLDVNYSILSMIQHKAIMNILKELQYNISSKLYLNDYVIFECTK